jgi:hypothetical protein
MTATSRRRPRLTQLDQMPAPVVDDLSANRSRRGRRHTRGAPHALLARRLRRAPARTSQSAPASAGATTRRRRPSPRPGPDLGPDRGATRPHRPEQRTSLPTRHHRPQGGLNHAPHRVPISPAPAASSTRRTAAGVKADRRSPAGLGIDTGEDRRNLTLAGATTQITCIMPN